MKNCIYLIVFQLTIASCVTSRNNKLIYKENLKHAKRDSLLKEFNLTAIQDAECKELNLSFRNNPLNFDSSYQVILAVQKTIVYEGFYSSETKVRVPLKLMNTKFSPMLFIGRNDQWYVLNEGQVLKTIKDSDNLIHIIFMPDNEYENIYFISTDWKINEN